MWSLEAALDLVVDFGSTLTQVGPEVRFLCEAMLVGSLGGPDYTGRGTRRVESAVVVLGVVHPSRRAE